MKVLIAPNAFKGSLSALQAGDAIKTGMIAGGFLGEIITCPIADGGDGTGDLLIEAMGAMKMDVETFDPLQRPVNTYYGWKENTKTAIIELANASGLRLLDRDEYKPISTTTFGTGVMIKQALLQGAKQIVFCIGGSATVDGATGILQALGFVFRDKEGNELTDLPLNLLELHAIDDSAVLQALYEVGITILCDVKNPMLGHDGAVAVFGPQKGATKGDLVFLGKAIEHLAYNIGKKYGKEVGNIPRGGAAGGVAAALFGIVNARLVDGADYFLEAIQFHKILKHVSFVITGEGKIDNQTFQGKAPDAVAIMAKAMNIPVIAVAGEIDLSSKYRDENLFVALLRINVSNFSLEENIANTKSNLILAGEKIAKQLHRFI